MQVQVSTCGPRRKDLSFAIPFPEEGKMKKSVIKSVRGSFTGKTGKKSPDTVQARRTFDAEMNKQFSDKNMITLLSIGQIIQITTFNVRRLAYWINNRSKKITVECANWLKANFGSYGGLVPNRHFV
ncbi:hypothetical protein H7169_00605 [Candidatus Gracilibacteria bacterium]|nr:hypothetical protein [Candidatus Gracilibacteria bacterium]